MKHGLSDVTHNVMPPPELWHSVLHHNNTECWQIAIFDDLARSFLL